MMFRDPTTKDRAEAAHGGDGESEGSVRRGPPERAAPAPSHGRDPRRSPPAGRSTAAPHPRDSAITSEFDARQLTAALRRRWGLIVGVATAGTVLVGIVGLLVPPSYTARAQIVVERPGGDRPGKAEPDLRANDEARMDTHLAILSSHHYALRLRDSLARDPTFQEEQNSPAKPVSGFEKFRQRLHASLSEPLTSISRSVLGLLQPDKSPVAIGPEVPDIEQLERRLEVRQERRSRVITVSYASTRPGEAMAIANRAVQLHVAFQAEQKSKDKIQTLERLKEQFVALIPEVKQAETRIEAYRIEHGLADGSRREPPGELVDLIRQLTVARSELARTSARLEQVRELRAQGSRPDDLVNALASVNLASLRHQALELERKASSGEGAPKAEPTRNALQAVRDEFSRGVEAAAASLQNEVETLRMQVRSIQQRLDTVRSATAELREPSAGLRELELEATATRQLYEGLLRRWAEASDDSTWAPEARLLSLAPFPERPSGHNPLLFLPPALILFSLGGASLAFVRERLDRTLRSERDVKDALGIPCIGLVPQAKLRPGARAHDLPIEAPFSAYTEAIRSVIVALRLTWPHDWPRTVLITSSLPGEGKTTLAASLAFCVARLGRRVLLVDLDLKHPGALQKVVGCQSVPEPDAIGAIQRVPGLALDVLTARRGADPLALMADGGLLRRLGELRGSYDSIVIDGPPLLTNGEASLIADMADEIVLVVKWGSTRREIAQHALEALCRRAGEDGTVSDFAGAVVAQVDLKKHARYRYGDIGECLRRYGGEGRAPPSTAKCGPQS